MAITAQDVLRYLETTDHQVRLEGNSTVQIMGFCSLSCPRSECITWIKDIKPGCLDGFSHCSSCIVISKEKTDSPMDDCCFLVTENPKAVFFSVLAHFWNEAPQEGIASSAIVESDRIGDHVSIGHHCYVGRDVSIGSGTIIEHNVSIYHNVSIGRNCRIHSGTVIGTDGFGYYMDSEGRPGKVIHYGGVQIGDEVEIGANNTISRGTIDDTVIDSFTKTDNLCHIAHNCRLGRGVLLTANTVLAGSVTLKDGVYIGPGGIIKNQLTLEENAFVGIGGVVLKDVERNTVVAGVPARPLRKVAAGDK
ncbi:MAG: hypothetical protein HFH90_14790 [Lachnospiraceae bacterium]|jgi:UDP-3-O-[3-hydroxymyristoyl] glucosamine N-acyltransferase LpxD|nr:hypothetical protein [Lachnospiraceae bacterium]